MRTRRAVQPVRCDSVSLQAHHSAYGMRISALCCFFCIGAFPIIFILRSDGLLIVFLGRLAGPGPTGLAGPRLWGGGPLGLRAQGPVRPGVVGCRWSLRACSHGTLGRLHCGCRRSRLRALLCPFLGGGRGCPCGGSPGDPVPWGSLDVWGPGLFHACFMPCGMGLLFPTHTIKHLHGGTL